MTHLAGDTQGYAEEVAAQQSVKVRWHLRAVANSRVEVNIIQEEKQ